MTIKSISSCELQAALVPLEDADYEELNRFALSFNGYLRWGSFGRCAANASPHAHDSIDKLRTWLFLESRSWRHVGDIPDEESLREWRKIVVDIRQRLQRFELLSTDWLTAVILQLPATFAAETEMRARWLTSIDGSTRGPGAAPPARLVYDNISEPNMLLWLATAAGVELELLQSAEEIASQVEPPVTACTAIRRLLPWWTLAEALEAEQASRMVPQRGENRILR
jgi:hypothetical protein